MLGTSLGSMQNAPTLVTFTITFFGQNVKVVSSSFLNSSILFFGFPVDLYVTEILVQIFIPYLPGFEGMYCLKA